MENIDIPFAKFVMDLVQLAFVIGMSIYVWVLQKTKANTKRINDYEESTNHKICAVERDITQIKTTLDHSPSSRHISNIHRRLDDQSSTLGKMEGELKGVADSVSIISNYLISKGEK